ncbi:MAG: hypothetical protein Q4P30_04545 [Eubacteriales bacterium]|nr:hypothetical protein [Eubacteriales bacterium]
MNRRFGILTVLLLMTVLIIGCGAGPDMAGNMETRETVPEPDKSDKEQSASNLLPAEETSIDANKTYILSRRIPETVMNYAKEDPFFADKRTAEFSGETFVGKPFTCLYETEREVVPTWYFPVVCGDRCVGLYAVGELDGTISGQLIKEGPLLETLAGLMEKPGVYTITMQQKQGENEPTYRTDKVQDDAIMHGDMQCTDILERIE